MAIAACSSLNDSVLCTSFEGNTEISAKSSNVLPCLNPRQGQSDETSVKLKATIIVAALLAARAAHAETRC